VKPVKTDTVLSDVLDDLVTKGTITAAQKSAIVDAVAAERAVRREARQEARKATREQAKANRQQLKGFLADGVITKDEFDKLPADSSLRKMTGLMDDGKITTDELKALGRGFMNGKGNGQGWLWKGKAPVASPSAGTSG
jgi:polyhydroxyalkanoate synthesis regulator phasin